MFASTFDSWCFAVSGRLAGYCGRTLADLPAGVEWWLRWAYQRGHDAQYCADMLSRIAWPVVTLAESKGIA